MREATFGGARRSNIRMRAALQQSQPANRKRKRWRALNEIAHKAARERLRGPARADASLRSARWWRLAGRAAAVALVPALCLLAGCSGGVAANSSNGSFTISPGTGTIDTNCTGCNATNSSGASVEHFIATLANGGAAAVSWTVSGGDANSGPGTISASGQYTPPSYLTANSVSVTVTATLNSSTTATVLLT